MSPQWAPVVPPKAAVGTGHRFGEPVSLEGQHMGLDVQAVKGTPAMSPVAGHVEAVWNEPAGLGQQVSVRGHDGNLVRFAHLNKVHARPGQTVGQGQQIADVGSTGGGSTGSHLDVRLEDPRGQYLDPSPMLGWMAQMPRADQPGAGQGGPRFGTGQSGGMMAPLARGGIYGAQKWSSPMGSNAVDIFVRRGSPVQAPVSGTIQQGQNGQLILVGDNGWDFAFRHGQTTAQGHVQEGQTIGYVNDPGLDSLGQAPWGGMPDGFQHLEMSVSRGSPDFPGTPGGGGNVDAAQWLNSIGYQGQEISKTPGPPDAMGGGMMGGGGFGGGMGMGGFPGIGGMGGGFGGGMPGMMGDPMSMMMGGMGSMGGMSPFGGMGGGMGVSPMMGMGGMGGSSFGGMGMGSQMGGMGSFGGSQMGMGMSPQMSYGGGLGASFASPVSSMAPAGQTGVPMPDFPKVDFSNLDALYKRSDTPTPWISNYQSPLGPAVQFQAPAWTPQQPGIQNVPLSQPPRPPWLPQSGAGQDVGALNAQVRARFGPQGPSDQWAGMTGAGEDWGPNPAVPVMPPRTFRNAVGAGADVGVGQVQSGQTQVMIDPTQAQTFQFEAQRLSISEQQLRQQLQQMQDNYNIALAQLQQNANQFGTSEQLAQQQMALDAQYKQATMGMQQQLADVQTQEYSISAGLQKYQLDQQFQTAQGQLAQQWAGHEQDLGYQYAVAQLDQQYKMASLGQQGALGWAGLAQQGQQFGQNQALQLGQTALGAQEFGQNLAAQTGLAREQMGQTAADAAANRQLSVYNSALQNPWLQQLGGLAPAWNAPGGPGQAGRAAAQGQMAVPGLDQNPSRFDTSSFQGGPGMFGNPNSPGGQNPGGGLLGGYPGGQGGGNYLGQGQDVGTGQTSGNALQQGDWSNWGMGPVQRGGGGGGDSGFRGADATSGTTDFTLNPSQTPSLGNVPQSQFDPSAFSVGNQQFTGGFPSWFQQTPPPDTGSFFPTNGWNQYVNSLQQQQYSPFGFNTGLTWPSSGMGAFMGQLQGGLNGMFGQPNWWGGFNQNQQQPPQPPQNPGGLNYQGWQQAFGQQGAGNPYDLNQDGIVDARDLGLLRQQQGPGGVPPPLPQGGNPLQQGDPTGWGMGPVQQQGGGGGTDGPMPYQRNNIWQPGNLFRPPQTPQNPGWGALQNYTPFQWGALRTQTEMSGQPWAQWTNNARQDIANQGGPTNTPNLTPLAGALTQQSPMATMGQNMQADFFGEGGPAFWQRQQTNWAPSQSSGANVIG